MGRLRFVVFAIMVAWSLPLQPAFAVGEQLRESVVARTDKQIADTKNILKRLFQQAEKAKDKNDIQRHTFLLTKVNLVKGLLKALERAKIVVLASVDGGDIETANAYQKKIDSYSESAAEVEKSLVENKAGKETAVIYIRPEGEAESRPPEGVSPWGWNFIPDAQGFPVVPPASPYR